MAIASISISSSGSASDVISTMVSAGIGRREELLPERHDLAEVAHVLEVDVHLDDLREAGAAGLQYCRQVLEGLLGLGVEIADADDSAVEIDGGSGRKRRSGRRRDKPAPA